MISTKFLTRSRLEEYLSELIEVSFGLEGVKLYRKQIHPIIKILREDLVFYLEYPYVDKYYRDTYYQFFSKKHRNYERNSVRISFFLDDVNNEMMFHEESEVLLQKRFFGYITLRPTTYKIIGHSFVSPKALIDNNFVSVQSCETVSIGGNRLKINGFPYISQDNESITCSESTLINVLGYFSFKYANYSLLLPSQVNKILSKLSHERQLPSNGLPTEKISFVLKKLGFGTMVYSYDNSKSKNIFEKKAFKEILFAYIESGIPIIATLSSRKNHHAILVVGRENIDKDIKTRSVKSTLEGFKLFPEAFKNVLIMDDNQPPYRLVDFEKPIIDPESKSYYKFKTIIVPLYSRIHLDAYQFKTIFFEAVKILDKNLSFKKERINLLPKGKYTVRYFIASGRSYKNYISKSKELDTKFKSLLIDKTMPKFIWVGEIFKGNTLKEKQEVSSIIVLDATESGKTGHLIFATNLKFLVFNHLTIGDEVINKYHVIKFDIEQKIFTFANNLKNSSL